MSSMSELDFRHVLKHIAENMRTDEQTDNLGLELKIDQSAIDGYKVANQRGEGYQGTHNMLKKWSSHQYQTRSLEMLRQALERLRRIDLYESILAFNFAETESGELNNLKKYLKTYTPKKYLNHEVVHIGLYGVIGCGKSALANSLECVITGTYKLSANEMPMEAEGTRITERIRITDHIHIMDNRGLRDLNIRQISDNIIPQICGKRGVNNRKRITEGTVIHCPVFVCNFIPRVCPRKELMEFIQKFASAVFDHYGRHMMVAISFKKELEKCEDLPDLRTLFRETYLPDDHIWVFENYTRQNHEHNDERSIAFLKFLKKCVEVGEKNIDFKIQAGAEKQSLSDRLFNFFHS